MAHSKIGLRKIMMVSAGALTAVHHFNIFSPSHKPMMPMASMGR